MIANLSCKKLYFNCSAYVQNSRLHIEQINQISNSHRNLKSKKAIIFIKTYGFTYLRNFRILSSSNEQSHQYTRKGLMSLINTEIKPFNATAYHKGQFVEVSEQDMKGKWSVVFFYPADFTFVCPTELGDLAD